MKCDWHFKRTCEKCTFLVTCTKYSPLVLLGVVKGVEPVWTLFEES